MQWLDNDKLRSEEEIPEHWESFFHKFGDYRVRLSVYDIVESISLETLYQLFTRRQREEQDLDND